MTIETITLTSVASNYLNEQLPTKNYGGNTTGLVGRSSNNNRRQIVRWEIPKFVGTVVAQRIKVNINSSSGPSTERIFRVYLMDSPKDDLWIEGIGTDVPDVDDEFGSNWDEYALALLWDTGGSDFGDDPMGIETFIDTFTGLLTIDVLPETFSFQSGKTQSIILRGSEVGNNYSITGEDIVLELDIDRGL